jgi:hypothetical protein
VPGADSLELVEVVHYVLRHLATLPCTGGQQRIDGSRVPEIQARGLWVFLQALVSAGQGLAATF